MRPDIAFLLVLAVTAAAVGPLVIVEETSLAFAAGVVGLVGHWCLSRGQSEEDEVADSSYFFGFILTLIFLAAGLHKLGVLGSPTRAPEATGSSTTLILGFLRDLAAGLGLTIVGLAIRQVRALSVAGRAATRVSLMSVQLELARTLQALADVWRQRPEHAVLEQLRESGSLTREASEQLNKRVETASRKMTEAAGKLEEATAEAVVKVTRSTTALSETLLDTAERLKGEVAQILEQLREQGKQTEAAFAAAHAEGAALRVEADQRLIEHRTMHAGALEGARKALDVLHSKLDEEYDRGIKGFGASGAAFAKLTTETVAHVEALPDPAERLARLWEGIASLERRLQDAVQGTVGSLTTLTGGSSEARSALAGLATEAGKAGRVVGTSAEAVRRGLEEELQQMNVLVSEYVKLLQNSTRALR